jgi:hypothetical protein
MVEANSVPEVFESIEGVEVNESVSSRHLVKVMSEDAVGKFYGAARRNNVELTAATRGDLSYTVLDAWAELE